MTTRERPGSWADCRARRSGTSETADLLAKACRKCASMRARISGLLRAQGVDGLCPARRWRQVYTETRHRPRAQDGPRIEGDKEVRSTYAPFDASAYLDNDAVIAEYLTAAAEDPNPEVFLAAFGDGAKARGMARIAKDSGRGRESLYKALDSGTHPRHETVSPA